MKSYTNLLYATGLLVFCIISAISFATLHNFWHLVYAIGFGVGSVLSILAFFYSTNNKPELTIATNSSNLATAIVCGICCIIAIAATVMTFTVWNLVYAIIFGLGCVLCLISFFYYRKE